MKVNVKNIFKTTIFLVGSLFIISSCESEADQLGLQFFDENKAKSDEKSFDIVAFNVNNNDSIQTDGSKLQQATIGAFTENNFGMQKSGYVSQVRLNAYNPDFGAKPVVDSVVLELKPEAYAAADSIKTTTVESFTYLPTNIEAKKVLTTYKAIKYGKAKKPLTLDVHEVGEYMKGTDQKMYSNQRIARGTLLGSKVFDGTFSAVKITKKSDGTELLTRAEAFRIPLNKEYFQNNIINKQGSFELKDAASFTRYFKGLSVSVAEDDGFIFNIKPSNFNLVMYYSYDKTENNAVTRTPVGYTFDIASGSNVHFNEIAYNRSSAFTTAIGSINTATGDPKLYLQGMGGPGAQLRIPAQAIAEIKKNYQETKAAILSAKIRLYTDQAIWNNSYTKPTSFLVRRNGETTFLADVSEFLYLSNFKLVNGVDLDKNPAYYDISITKTLKDIVEKELENKDLIINVGEYLRDSNSLLMGQNYNTRAYSPYRIVLVGTDPTNPNRASLKITYSTK